MDDNWKFEHNTNSKGFTYSLLLGPHNNTHTRIREHEAPILEQAIRTACLMLKHEEMTENDLRAEIPGLAAASTPHIRKIIQRRGTMNATEVNALVDEILSDAASGKRLEPAYVSWCRTHKLRAKSYPKPGRPRKAE